MGSHPVIYPDSARFRQSAVTTTQWGTEDGGLMMCDRLKLQPTLQRGFFFKSAVITLGLALAVSPGMGQDTKNLPELKKPAPDSEPAKSPANSHAVPTVVALPVTVRDKHGQIVKDLSKDDFTLLEDGRPQPVTSFSADPAALTLGLLVDTSPGQREFLEQERNASRNFLDQQLTQEKDKAFLLHFDHEVELLQDLTHNREKMQSALDSLRPGEQDDDRRSTTSDDSRQRRPRTQLYDSLYLASSEVLKQQPGRKAVIILSDGVDRGSKTTLESALEAAQRANIVVYTIYFKGEQERRERRDEGYPGNRGGGYPGGGGPYPGGGPFPGGGGPYPGGGRRGGDRRPEEPKVDGKKILQRFAKQTGGRYFEFSKKESVGDIYASIADELKTRYSLGFAPDKDAAGEGYHHVVLQVKKHDVNVQAPEGYYGVGDS